MNSIKRILFDGRFLSLSHAGIGRYSYELLKHILPQDESQKYILLVNKDTTFDSELSKILTDREIPVDIVETNIGHYSLAEQTELPRLLKSLRPDLVHFPHFNHPVLYRGKFVVTIHDLTLSQYAERGGKLKKYAYHWVISHAARKSEKILTVSDFVKNDLARVLKIPKNKIVTTYNGVDQKFCKITNPRALKQTEKYGIDKQYILYVGQWREHKNLIRLIEAFYQIANEKKFEDKLDLVFAGRPDPKFPYLITKVKELGLRKVVKFTGFVEDADLPILYNNAEMFVFPSLSEGFGLPGLEAQSCGIPLLASNRTCFTEIFGSGALYFDPENVSDMAEKILKVLEDKDLKSELIEKGFKNAERFDWQDVAFKTLEVYREIVYK